jgi:hypothetical protein
MACEEQTANTTYLHHPKCLELCNLFQPPNKTPLLETDVGSDKGLDSPNVLARVLSLGQARDPEISRFGNVGDPANERPLSFGYLGLNHQLTSL